MSLDVGARLGHYAVTAKFGEGGMGEVWRATDTQLNRDVALKILPEAFATDPDRLARFQREAQVLERDLPVQLGMPTPIRATWLVVGTSRGRALLKAARRSG